MTNWKIHFILKNFNCKLNIKINLLWLQRVNLELGLSLLSVKIHKTTINNPLITTEKVLKLITYIAWQQWEHGLTKTCWVALHLWKAI